MDSDVTLAPIDERVLHDLLAAATEEADADEVTPPLTPGLDWTEVRQQWFLQYHRDRRDQLNGPATESTWAVLIDGRPVGAVRLQRVLDDSTAETGIWLARSVRGRGIGTDALRAVLAKARAAGITTVVAVTTATNSSAQAALRRVGFRLEEATRGGRLRGTFEVHDIDRPSL